MRVSTFKK